MRLFRSPPRRELLAAALLFCAGFAPITALALSLFEWVPLPIGTLALVLPCVAAVCVTGLFVPSFGALAATGLLFGIGAVFCYDALTRFPLLAAGAMADFIPRIGVWLTGLGEPDWRLGYLWRYLGNGGGMGVAFTGLYVLLRPRLEPRLAGIVFGVAVWCCLMGTLRLAPGGSDKLFVLTPFTFVISLLGHVVYGASLGQFVWLRDRRGAHAEPAAALR